MNLNLFYPDSNFIFVRSNWHFWLFHINISIFKPLRNCLEKIGKLTWGHIYYYFFFFFLQGEKSAGVDPSATASCSGWLAVPAAAGRGCSNWCSPCRDWCQGPSQKVSFIHFPARVVTTLQRDFDSFTPNQKPCSIMCFSVWNTLGLICLESDSIAIPPLFSVFYNFPPRCFLFSSHAISEFICKSCTFKSVGVSRYTCSKQNCVMRENNFFCLFLS